MCDHSGRFCVVVIRVDYTSVSTKVCTLKMYTYSRIDCTLYLSERAVFCLRLGYFLTRKKAIHRTKHQIPSNIIFHSMYRAHTPVTINTNLLHTLQLLKPIPTGLSNVTGYLYFSLTESISGMLGFHLDICMSGSHTKCFFFLIFRRNIPVANQKRTEGRTEGPRGAGREGRQQSLPKQPAAARPPSLYASARAP